MKLKDVSASGSNAAGMDDTYEMENFFVMRLPKDQAKRLNERLLLAPDSVQDLIAINFDHSAPTIRQATVRFDKQKFRARLVDLPCVIEVLKTLDRKNFYKVADLCQMLCVETSAGPTSSSSSNETSDASGLRKKRGTQAETEHETDVQAGKEKHEHLHPHGLTAPMKNVRRRGFRKTLRKKYMDAPELERELKRLLRQDLQASSVRWEVVTSSEHAAAATTTTAQSDQPNAMSAQQLNVALNPDIPSIPIPSISPSKIQESDVFGEALSSSDEEDDNDIKPNL